MAIIQTDVDERYVNGQVVAATTRDVDVTEAVVTLDLHAKVRAALSANATYLALASPTAAQNTAQIRRLTRQINALTRLALAADLLRDNADT